MNDEAAEVSTRDEDLRKKLKELLRLYREDFLSSDETIDGIIQDCAAVPQGVAEAVRLLNKIADLVDDEDACEPLDDAIRYANEALAALAVSRPEHQR